MFICGLGSSVFLYLERHSYNRKSSLRHSHTALYYVFLLILFTRAVTLPGSLEGIMYYITPTWIRLADPKVNTPIYIPGCTLPHFSADV